MEKIIKYPRTKHLQGSKIQSGDEDLNLIAFSEIKNKNIVIEEKVDGANVGISFSSSGELLLQSRGHFLVGGYRERHYNLFKTFANENYQVLYCALKDKYIMYGEWLYVKHKIYYDLLPSYFLEFDIYDKEKGVFLDTFSRKEILKNLPIYSVPVLDSGKFSSENQVLKNLQKSTYRSINALDNLISQVEELHLNVEEILKETDKSNLMEGLYIKVEENGIVKDRVKFVRDSYIQNQLSTTKWLDKPIITNKLK